MTAVGITDLKVTETPIAIVDVETTGLSPHGDRVIELAVVRCEPACRPEVVLDTLINPQRKVTATHIHGITDDDVKGAPVFADISAAFLHSLRGCVLAAYNVYFDAGFLRMELEQVGLTAFPPHVCLMWMRPMLQIGKRCTLGDACKLHGLETGHSHAAADDALACAALWAEYLSRMRSMGVMTFADLARLKPYKFTSSFALPVLAAGLPNAAPARLRSRTRGIPQDGGLGGSSEMALAEYWEALKAILADLVITDDEVEYLRGKRRELGVPEESMRWLHARAYSGILTTFSSDREIDAKEADLLHAVSTRLAAIGWSPGDPMPSPCTSASSAMGRRLLGWFRGH